jgi:hypothetical protein
VGAGLIVHRERELIYTCHGNLCSLSNFLIRLNLGFVITKDIRIFYAEARAHG